MRKTVVFTIQKTFFYAYYEHQQWRRMFLVLFLKLMISKLNENPYYKQGELKKGNSIEKAI